MKTLKERVIEQIQAEYRVNDDGAERKIMQMGKLELLEYISGELDEMFKEFKSANETNHRFVRDEQY